MKLHVALSFVVFFVCGGGGVAFFGPGKLEFNESDTMEGLQQAQLTGKR